VEVAAVKPAEDARIDLLALILAVAWAAGALASHWIGLWWGISGVAIGGGALALVTAGTLLVPRLRPTPATLAFGIIAGAVTVAATYALYPVAGRLAPWLQGQTHALYGLMGGIPPAVSVAMLPLIILGEELVWRGVVQEALSRRFGPAWSVPLAATAYALAHAPAGNLLLTFLCLACGLYWSALRARTGSLLVPLLSHLIWDAVVFLAAPLAGR
jgi:membrane protease YdiL (CAAX protease family)